MKVALNVNTSNLLNYPSYFGNSVSWLRTCYVISHNSFIPFIHSFIQSFIHSILHSFNPHFFIHSFYPSFCPSFYPSFYSSFYPSFYPLFYPSFLLDTTRTTRPFAKATRRKPSPFQLAAFFKNSKFWKLTSTGQNLTFFDLF